MASITTWARLEPDPVAADVVTGAAAPVHDALWLLTRQWQLGEFAGHDGGSPILARWRGVAAPLTRFVAGRLPPNTMTQAPPLDTTLPLETLVEHVDRPFGNGVTAADVRLGVDTGRHFLAMLAAEAVTGDYRQAFIDAYAVQQATATNDPVLDPGSAAYLSLHSGRSLDGRRLLAELAARDLPRLATTIAPGDVAEVRDVCRRWARWARELVGGASRPASWQPDRFEYRFSVSGRLSPDPFDETTLTAHRYDSDTLDWYEFDLNAEVNVGTTAEEAGPVVTSTSIPTPVSAPGLPAPRFWEFEDGQLNLAALDPAPTDIAALLLIETLSGFGNDWYTIGVDLPVGTLATAHTLVVTDTFGARALLRPNGHPSAASGHWAMFTQAMPIAADMPRGASRSNLLFVAPRLVQPLRSAVVEQVTLARDELSNLGWAIEQVQESPLGVGVSLERDAPAPDEPDDDGDDDAPRPRYRLADRTPAYRVPLLPVRSGDSAEILLARGSMLDFSGAARLVRSVTDLLGGGAEGALLVPEEEIPAEGLVVQRTYQAARGTDGTLHLWAAHRAITAETLPATTLRFDRVEE